jgi:hypothetical protein
MEMIIFLVLEVTVMIIMVVLETVKEVMAT